MLGAPATAGAIALDSMGRWSLSGADKTPAHTFCIRRLKAEEPPLHVHIGAQRVTWDTDSVRLAKCVGVDHQLDASALTHHLWRGRPPAGRSFFQGIRTLAAGEELVCAAGQRPVVRRHAWPLSVSVMQADPATLPKTALAHIRQAIRQSLKAIAPDTPSTQGLGLLLSGGVDSGLLAALLARDHALTGYTVAFDDRYGLNETEYAAHVAQHVGARHRVVSLDVAQARALLQVVLSSRHPMAAPAAITQTALLQAARADGHQVVLSGLGADECFGGYHKPLACLAAQVHHRRRLGDMDTEGLYRLPVRRLLSLRDVLFPGIAEFFSHQQMALLVTAPGMVSAWAEDDVRFYAEAMAAKPQALPTELMAAHEYQFRVSDLLLPALTGGEDPNCARVAFPFLVQSLYTWAASLDPGVNYWHEGQAWWAKKLLRQVARRHLPESIVMRHRQVLLAPFGHWLVDKAFRQQVMTEIADSAMWSCLPIQSKLRTNLLAQLRNYKAPSTDGQWQEQLWATLTLAAWFNRHTGLR